MLDFFRHTYRLKFIQKIFFILFFLTISPNIKAADKSLSFDGTDDFVEIAANSVLNPTGDYTVAAWFKQEGEGSGDNDYQSIITSRSTPGTGDVIMDIEIVAVLFDLKKRKSMVVPEDFRIKASKLVINN